MGRKNDTQQLGTVPTTAGSSNRAAAEQRQTDSVSAQRAAGAVAEAARQRLQSIKTTQPTSRPTSTRSVEVTHAIVANEARGSLVDSDSARVPLDLYYSQTITPAQRGPELGNVCVPQIDRLELRVDHVSTAEDRTSVRIIVVIDVEKFGDSDISLLRIMRSKPGPLRELRIPRVLGSTALDLLVQRGTSKNGDLLSSYSRRLTAASGALDKGSPVDAGTGLRVGKVKSRATVEAVESTDDLLTSNRFAVQKGRVDLPSRPVTPRPSAVSTTSVTSSSQTARDEFFELASFAIEPRRVRRVGQFIELSYNDDSISYGHSYSYFVTSVDSRLRESVRSQIVSIETVLNTPPPPAKVTVQQLTSDSLTVSAMTDWKYIEKFEVYRRDDAAEDPERSLIDVIAGQTGVFYSTEDRNPLPSGFIQIGEMRASPGRGGTLRDMTVLPTHRYEYRIYAVDCFGNKQQVPTDIPVVGYDAQMPDTVRKPSVEAAVDQAAGFINLKVDVDDPTVSAVFIGRRDTTTRQIPFGDPTLPSYQWLGIQAPRLVSTNNAPHVAPAEGIWNGYHQLPGTGSFRSLTFVDQLTRRGRSYQYSVHCIGNRGARSSHVQSKVLGISLEPRIDPPVGLKADLSLSGSDVSAVVLTWSEANVVHSADDLLGSQDDLDDTRVRSIYQVQRRVVDGRWEEFPLLSGTVFRDTLSSEPAPGFRPAYPRLGRSYQYRVASLQTGSVYSMYCDPVTVNVEAPPPAPTRATARLVGLHVRPLTAIVSWDDAPVGSLPDGWEIQRADLNLFYYRGLKIDFDASTLTFGEIMLVPVEASRAAASTADGNFIGGRSLQDRFYVDGSVSVGNVYVYRVRLVTRSGQRSRWAYSTLQAIDTLVEQRVRNSVPSSRLSELAATQVPIDMTEMER